MDNAFDPYRKWLGIPPVEQPPNHYRLLGVPLFEEDLETISHAADQRMAYVRTLSLGSHADVCQRILNELAAANVCLLVADKKAGYDTQLRAKLAASEPPPVAVVPSPSAQASYTVQAVPPPQAIPLMAPSPSANRLPRPMDPPSARLPQRQSAGRSSTRNFTPLKLIVGLAAGIGVIVLAGIMFRGNPAPPKDATVVASVSAPQPSKPVRRGPELPSSAEAADKAKGDKVKPAESVNERPPPVAAAPFSANEAKRLQEQWAAYLKIPLQYTNSVGMNLILIPPGEFLMGSTPGEIEAAVVVANGEEFWKEHIRSEAPRHKVILSQPIYLGVHEVTQAQYMEIMEQNPSYFAAAGAGKDAIVGLDTSTFPVEMVNWSDAAEFCSKLSKKEQLERVNVELRAGETAPPERLDYRLPTEAEWEFACRAGTMSRFWIGNQEEQLAMAAWIGSNSDGRTHAVGELMANPFGLYDVHGHVWEWVQDWWEPAYYRQFQGRPALDPSGPSSAGSLRVIRGGDCRNTAAPCRAPLRYAYDPTAKSDHIGFRVALAVDAVKVVDR